MEQRLILERLMARQSVRLSVQLHAQLLSVRASAMSVQKLGPMVMSSVAKWDWWVRL